jgi:hypothetical protein
LGKAAIKYKEIEKGTHKSLIYQHNTKPLLHAVWADNNFDKTLSNFHSPTIVEGGMKRRVRDPVTKRGEVRVKPQAISKIYNWDGQTHCPRTDCFKLDATS